MRQWTVDAFASGPFRGNPACVVEPFAMTAGWPEERWMQALAAENNQAETAYLLRTEDPGRFGLRWFTPTLEAPLCGHATLAAAQVLFFELGVAAERLCFETRSGTLMVRRLAGRIEMDFPADVPRVTTAPEGLAAALGVVPVEVWVGAYLVAVLADEAAVRRVAPDLGALVKIGGEAREGAGQVVVVARADAGAGYDVVSRFFAPGFGIPEDPATGSAHCILAPLYGDKLGRRTLVFHQAYPGRGGDLECEHIGARVLLRGCAVTMMEGRLRALPGAVQPGDVPAAARR
jgi:PhzF family phenazine biosynthesis protein